MISPEAIQKTMLLILSIHPGGQTLADMLEISRQVEKIAPEIAIHIAGPGTTAKDVPAWKGCLPTLVVSLYETDKFIPSRGRILQNRAIGKLDQFKRFSSVDLPTPYTERFDFGRIYGQQRFGRFSVLKPLPLAITSTGKEFYFCETSRLTELRRQDFDPQHFLRRAPALVQQFVDTGKRPEYFRVLTLFGQPLLWMRVRSAREQINLHEYEGRPVGEAIVDPRTTYGDEGADFLKLIEFKVPHDVLDYATQVNRAFPEVPLQACDILREERTGVLYIVEINAGGNTWDFSSRRVAASRERLGGRSRLLELFDPWPKAAQALVGKVHEMAS